jgi:GNAT superfamily N-acetyltransferase
MTTTDATDEFESRTTTPAPIDMIRLSYSHHEDYYDDGDDGPQFWHVSADIYDLEGRGQLEHVGDFEFVRINPYEISDLFGVLDGHDGDLGLMAETLLNPATGDYRDDLEELTEPIHSSMLILNRAQLEKPWQGFGLGVLLTARAIRKLRPDCRGIACFPAPITGGPTDPDDKETRPLAIATLGKVWEQIGFEHYRDGVFVLNLGTVTLDEAIQALASRAAKVPQPNEDAYLDAVDAAE